MYLYVKAIHVFAGATLIGGMLLLAFTLKFAGVTNPASERERRFIDTVLTWDSYVTTPALGIVWIAGFTMAFGGGWFTAPWLLTKMIPVLFLSMLHGMEGSALKRMAATGGDLSPLLRNAPGFILIAFAVIACLAVAKPF